MPGTLNVGGHDIITHSGTAGAGDVTVNVQNRLVLNSSGNVGIGTASPTYNLTIKEPTNSSAINLSTAGSGGCDVILQATRSGAALIGVGSSNGALAFGTGNTTGIGSTERMRIDSSGNVGIGTTGNATTGGILALPNGNNSLLRIGHVAGSGSTSYYHQFFYDGNQIGSIWQNGTTGVSYNTSSDYRLKENVTDIVDGIDRVKALNPCRFNFISEPDRTVDGFLAHEVQAVVHEAVGGNKDEVDDEGNPVYQGIDQSKLVPLLTAALQEAISKIEALTTRIEALENA